MPQRLGWLMAVLLLLLMVVNYADKTILGLAAVPIMRDPGRSPAEFGTIGSAFYALFSVSAVVTGFIVNRVESRWVLLVMAMLWSATQVRAVFLHPERTAQRFGAAAMNAGEAEGGVARGAGFGGGDPREGAF